MCAVNSGRFWMMDEADYAGGDTQDFHGVGMNWAGDMTGAEMLTQFQSAYVPSLIQRNTIWTWHAGSRCTCCASPTARCGSCRSTPRLSTRASRPTHSTRVGSKLPNLPAGWKFETKVLAKELTLDTARAGGWAAIIRDDLHCTYQGCGYGADTSANYIP